MCLQLGIIKLIGYEAMSFKLCCVERIWNVVCIFVCVRPGTTFLRAKGTQSGRLSVCECVASERPLTAQQPQASTESGDWCDSRRVYRRVLAPGSGAAT